MNWAKLTRAIITKQYTNSTDSLFSQLEGFFSRKAYLLSSLDHLQMSNTESRRNIGMRVNGCDDCDIKSCWKKAWPFNSFQNTWNSGHRQHEPPLQVVINITHCSDVKNDWLTNWCCQRIIIIAIKVYFISQPRNVLLMMAWLTRSSKYSDSGDPFPYSLLRLKGARKRTKTRCA